MFFYKFLLQFCRVNILTTIPFQLSGECQYSNYSVQLDVKLTRIGNSVV